MSMLTKYAPPRSALFVPASNPGALAKIGGLAADMVIIELEDGVPADQKDSARAAAAEALRTDLGDERIKALRINGAGTFWHDDDIRAAADSQAQAVVLPKAESATQVERISNLCGMPLIAMIETPRGVEAVRDIAAARGVQGLIAGTNDLAADLRLPADPEREGLRTALQLIVLAARAADIWAFDGVCNAFGDEGQLEAECVQGRRWGFDGKTLIHPRQIETAHRLFGPGEGEIAEAEAIVAAAQGSDGVGAIRVGDRMIEDLHVRAAKAVLAQVGRP